MMEAFVCVLTTVRLTVRLPDHMPLPRVNKIIKNLGGKSRSALGMSKAYQKGLADESCRHWAAFSTPWALCEWNRISFRMCNAPPAFQRYINECLKGLREVICIPYLDNILFYSNSFEEHLDNLKLLFKKTLEHGI